MSIKIRIVRDEHECVTKKLPLQVYAKDGKTIALFACDRCGDFFTNTFGGEFSLADFAKRDATEQR